MRRIGVLVLLILLVYDHPVSGYNIALNPNRKFLFGDVLEPLCSIDTSGETLSKSDIIQLFHVWENFTSSQIATSSEISDYRKAMPCFPGPPLNISTSNQDLIPPYPNCDTFVNISTTTIEEVEELLEEMKKEKRSQIMDVSLKSVINSLNNRLQNLADYLPEGDTRQKIRTYLSTLLQMNTQPFVLSPPHPNRNYSNPHSKFNPSQLLSCFNISSFSPMDLLGLSDQTIGAIACSQFQICSFLDFTQNSCVSMLNVTEEQYDSVINKTIGQVLKSKIGKSLAGKLGDFFGGRNKRTPKPSDSESDSEDVTMNPKDILKSIPKEIPKNVIPLPMNALCSYLDEGVNGTRCENGSEDDGKDSGDEKEDLKIKRILESRRLEDSEDVRNSTDSGDQEGNEDRKILKILDPSRPEDSEDVTRPSEIQRIQIIRDSENVRNSTDSEGLQENEDRKILRVLESRKSDDLEDVTEFLNPRRPKDSEDVTKPSAKVLRILEFRDLEHVKNATDSEDQEEVGDRKFLKILNSESSEDSKDVANSDTRIQDFPSVTAKKIQNSKDSEDVTKPNTEIQDFLNFKDSEDVQTSTDSDVHMNSEDVTKPSAEIPELQNIQLIRDSDDVETSTDSGSQVSKILSSRRSLDSEDATKPSAEIQKIQQIRDSEDVRNSGSSEDLNEVTKATLKIQKIRDSEDIGTSTDSGSRISKFSEPNSSQKSEDVTKPDSGILDSLNSKASEDLRSSTDSNDPNEQNSDSESSALNFNEALNFFKTHTTSSESDDVTIEKLQILLNTPLNASILESSPSLLNLKIQNLSENLGSEFSVSQLLNNLDIQNWSSLSQIFQELKSVLPEFSGVEKLIGKLSESGLDVSTVLKMGTSKSSVADFLNPSILEKFGF